MAEQSIDPVFTASETKLLISIMKHLKGDIDSDFGAVATELGYKDATIAKVRWRQIRVKKIHAAGASPGGVHKTTPNKKTGKAKQPTVPGEEEGDDTIVDSPTPKRGRKPKAVAKIGADAAQEVVIKREPDLKTCEDSDSDSDEIVVKQKTTPGFKAINAPGNSPAE